MLLILGMMMLLLILLLLKHSRMIKRIVGNVLMESIGCRFLLREILLGKLMMMILLIIGELRSDES